MGWGNGMSIGWPNASNQNTPGEMVYFAIEEACSSFITFGITSQLVDSSIYHTGDFVQSDTIMDRVRLGYSQNSPGGTIYEISGPTFTDCLNL